LSGEAIAVRGGPRVMLGHLHGQNGHFDTKLDVRLPLLRQRPHLWGIFLSSINILKYTIWNIIQALTGDNRHLIVDKQTQVPCSSECGDALLQG